MKQFLCVEYKFHDRRRGHWISFPFIWFMIIPLFLFDICLEIYHRICFPIYGIKIVRRKDYIRMDRHKLSYLGIVDKINCEYCGYANGLMQYAARIAGDTEKYWCGIKHKRTKGYSEPSHHKGFLEYGDEKAYRQKYNGR